MSVMKFLQLGPDILDRILRHKQPTAMDLRMSPKPSGMSRKQAFQIEQSAATILLPRSITLRTINLSFSKTELTNLCSSLTIPVSQPILYSIILIHGRQCFLFQFGYSFIRLFIQVITTIKHTALYSKMV